MQVLDRVLSDLRSREAAAASGFRDLARAIFYGSPVDSESVAAVLAAAGKSPDDLQAAVEAIASRAKLRFDHDALPELQQGLRDVEAQLAAAADERDRAVRAAHARYAAESPRLIAQRDQFHADLPTAKAARAALIRSAPPESQARFQAAQTRDAAAKAHLARLRASGDECRRHSVPNAIGTVPKMPEGLALTQLRREHELAAQAEEKRLANVEGRAAVVEAALPGAEAEASAAAIELAEAEAELLVP